MKRLPINEPIDPPVLITTDNVCLITADGLYVFDDGDELARYAADHGWQTRGCAPALSPLDKPARADETPERMDE